jgi:hypothetical protein
MTDTPDRLLEAVNELVKPWNEIVPPDQAGDGYRVIDHQPRITMLRGLIGSSSGGTTAGRSLAATRNILNVSALDLWQRIDEQTRSHLHEIGTTPKKELIDALEQLGQAGDALRATNDMTEKHHSRIVARVQKWKADIENLFDPPRTKTLTGACPDCGAERVTTGDGETTALYAYYWEGHEPAAACRACGKAWHGSRPLLELGFSLAANMDEDALAEMGLLT